MSVIKLNQYCMLKGMQKRASSETRHRVWIAPSEIAARSEVKLAEEQGFCLVTIIQGFDILCEHACTLYLHVCQTSCPSPKRQWTHCCGHLPVEVLHWVVGRSLFLLIGSGDMNLCLFYVPRESNAACSCRQLHVIEKYIFFFLFLH